MILFTSVTDKTNSNADTRRMLVRFLIAAIAAAGFFLIYDQFSHDVRSPYMTFLFAWPLLLGVLPASLFLLKGHVNRGRSRTAPGPWVRLFWGGGVAAATLSSMLRGIFEIAGTASIHQTILLGIGFTFLAAAICLYLAGRSTVQPRSENSFYSRPSGGMSGDSSVNA